MSSWCPHCGEGYPYVPSHVATLDELSEQVLAKMPLRERIKGILTRRKSGQLTDAEAMAEIQTTVGEK